MKAAALILIVLGILGLVYGGFSYTDETHEAKLGPIEFSVKDRKTVNIPVWLGIGAIVVGGAMFWEARNPSVQDNLDDAG